MSVSYTLPSWHVQALEWFEQNAGRTFARRPFDVGLPTKVTSLQRGIWKPAATKYALSVVQTHKGVYDDLPPFSHDDGTWEYFYHQEGKTAEDLAEPQRLYANAGLFSCWDDGIPVGVIVPGDGGAGYKVLGLALVNGYRGGRFELVGPVSLGANAASVYAAEAPASVSIALLDTSLGEPFDPHSSRDSRLKVIASVHRRQGGARFRRALVSAYRGSCAMTGYDAVPALEAAHIVPYRGQQTNNVANGLLLRADMHDLFDLGLVAVDTDSMSLLLSKELSGTQYEAYHGRRLWVPPETELQPNVEALNMHRAQSAVA